MTAEYHLDTGSYSQSGRVLPPIRVATVGHFATAGVGWAATPFDTADIAALDSAAVDCLLITSDCLSEPLERLALPVIVAVTDDAVPAAAADRADAFVFPDDDAATLAAVIATACATDAIGVRDVSDGTVRTINALSAEASRIADALARLAQTAVTGDVAPVDAPLVRRILKVRRDRARYFPVEIFADPAWDMMLDLAAAQLEGKPVPVSSLCIAAAVPTTTALRWIRSLSHAGLFERHIDPADARRNYISLSETAATATFAWLRNFSEQFALR